MSEVTTDFSLCGTKFEGGGGLIRDSLTYSAILNRSLQIYDIRANRPGVGGLRVEHTTAIDTMARLSHAIVKGNKAQSRILQFWPHTNSSTEPDPASVRSNIDIELEGSASIALVALLPFALFADLGAADRESKQDVDPNGMTITIRGGTLCIKAPSIHYLHDVWLPTLNMIGLGGHVSIDVNHTQGWHMEHASIPGKITATAIPLSKPLDSFRIDGRGIITSLKVVGTAPARCLSQFREILSSELETWFENDAEKDGLSIHVEVHETIETAPDMYHLLISAHASNPEAHLGKEQVYPRDQGFPKDLEGDVGAIMQWLTRSVLRGLKEELWKGHAVDEHMQNILVPYMALARGRSSAWSVNDPEKVRQIDSTSIMNDGPPKQYSIDDSSLHYETAEWVASELTGVKFHTLHDQYGCSGIGVGCMN